jgi:hypothetical protein
MNNPNYDATVALLEKRGFVSNREETFEGESGPTNFMSKRVTKFSTRYAEVAPDGTVNGEDVTAFLKSL